MALTRTPPAAVRRRLRAEIGFGCPVSGCSSPYLEYHHFEPKWYVKAHHNPEGMIPLCREHHSKAAAWTPSQFRQMKAEAATNAKRLTGRFEWMRHNVIGLIGGNFYWNTMTMVTVQSSPVIWFERSDEGILLLNVKMITASTQPRAEMVNNDWFICGAPTDVNSPPSGRMLRVTYANGDDLQIEFREFKKLENLASYYKLAHTKGFTSSNIPFPLLVAEIKMRVAGTGIDFTATKTKIGASTLTGFGIFQVKDGLIIT